MESTVRNVWVDHVTLEASGGESEGYDGLFDLKNDVQYVTLSYCILRNSGRGGLIGSSETDTGNGYITFHHNLYSNLDSRTPLLRGGIAHIYNNSYVNLNESGINSRAGAKAKVENNYFKNSKDVLGTFYTDQAGTWQVAGNIFDNVTWSAKSSENNPAGPNVVSTTSVSIPYSYSLDGASCVPDRRRPDGRRQHGPEGLGRLVHPDDADRHADVDPDVDPDHHARRRRPPRPRRRRRRAAPTSASAPGADGSSKGSGTSYGNVKDGSLSTYWSPSGSTGSISIKWGSATKVVEGQHPGDLRRHRPDRRLEADQRRHRRGPEDRHRCGRHQLHARRR